MKIAVFGAGAVGGYFGGRLAQSGEEVIFIARGKHLQAMQNHGLKIDSGNGDFIVQSIQATDNPKDVVFKTMKCLDALPPGGTASMQRDMMDGKPSELETQAGAVLCLAQDVELKTPVHFFMISVSDN
jgi:ketopantoate reductase